MEINRFKFISCACALYAIFTTFCLFDNESGITMPLFVVGTLYFLYYLMEKLDIPLKKTSRFHIVCILLIGISTFITDDSEIIALNYLVLAVLFISFMIHNCYDDEKWTIDNYFAGVLQVVCHTIRNITKPFTDFSDYRKNLTKKENSQSSNIIIGIVIAIPLLVIVLALLMNSDIVFLHMFYSIFHVFTVPEDMVVMIIMTVLVFLLSYGFIRQLVKKDKALINKEVVVYESLIAITFNLLLLIVYVIFSVIQIMYLFYGKMSLPAGYTYAQYAREGFFQLLIVCIINLILVLFCLYRFKHNEFLKVLLAGISFCTYVMITSSAVRMIIYVGAYGLTFLRFFVLWSLMVIFILITGVLMLIFKQNKFRFYPYAFITVSGLYILLSFSHPDYIIASYNLNNHQSYNGNDDNKIDVVYLSSLSSDAALAIDKYYREEPDNIVAEEYFNRIQDGNKNNNIRNFNISRMIAEKLSKR